MQVWADLSSDTSRYATQLSAPCAITFPLTHLGKKNGIKSRNCGRGHARADGGHKNLWAELLRLTWRERHTWLQVKAVCDTVCEVVREPRGWRIWLSAKASKSRPCRSTLSSTLSTEQCSFSSLRCNLANVWLAEGLAVMGETLTVHGERQVTRHAHRGQSSLCFWRDIVGSRSAILGSDFF